MAGLYFLSRPERVVVSDFHSGVYDLIPWIPHDHPAYGWSVDEICHYLVKKYLRPNPEIQARVDEFHRTRLASSRFVAVHVRGSDKQTELSDSAAVNERYFAVVDRFLADRANSQVFLMTDDQRWLERFSKRYGAKLVTTDCRRTANATGVHYQESNDRRNLGVEVMVDAYVAARTDAFVGNGCSNPSTYVRHLKDWAPDDICMFGQNMHQRYSFFIHGSGAQKTVASPAVTVPSYSQFGQDKWVVKHFAGKRDGFFLEMGAGDGNWISNTLLLESQFGWRGILVEPSSSFEHLVKNRPQSICDNSCVASTRKKVTLFEVLDKGQAQISERAQANRLLSQVRDDMVAAEGERLNTDWGIFERAVERQAIPLQELLAKHNAPRTIDYFSLDVEGYEYEVLRNFPFDEYKFLCLGVERPSDDLRALLKSNGYRLRARVGEDWMYTAT